MVAPRQTLMPRRGRINSVSVRLAAALLRPRTAAATMGISLVAFLVLNFFIITLMKTHENLFMDSTEAYAWGRQFLWGYGRHPPLTGWIAGVWYRVFPAANWSSHLLSQLMTAISLVSIYLIGRRVLGLRRATLVVFVMMLYPLFIGAKADRFNNYQVLLAVTPLTVWLFLRCYESPTVRSGIAFGFAAGAAMLTIYSAAFGLGGMALAAVAHPQRRRFFMHPAPYVAAIVLCLVLTPHVVWLIKHNFSTLHWAEGFVGMASGWSKVGKYLGHHFALLAFCLVAAAIALWPWRWLRAAPEAPPFANERLLVLVIAGVLVAAPIAATVPSDALLKVDWGNSCFFLVPVAVAALLPNVLVTRRAVAVAAWIAAIFAVVLLAIAPIYAWARFRHEPGDGPYQPLIEAAAEITTLWHERFHSPLPIVVSGFENAAPIVFYSADHPKMFADFNPAYSPWIDYPDELARKGFVGVCLEADGGCRAYIKSLNPHAEALDITLRRQAYGLSAPSLKLHLEFTGPRS